MKNDEELSPLVEKRLSWIIEHSTDVFFIHTIDDEIIYISPQVVNILGCTQAEALVKWTEFATDHPINQKAVINTRKAIETGEAQPAYEMELIRADGNKVWVEVRETPIIENGKVNLITGSLTDISQRKRSELIQRTLFNISNAMIETGDLPELFQRLHQLLNEVVKVSEIYIALMDHKEQKIQFPYFESKYNIKPEPVNFAESRGLTQLVLEKGEAILVDSTEIMQLQARGWVNLQGEIPRQWLGIPLKTGKDVIGVLSVQSYEESNSFSADDVELLTFVSEEIALAIRSKQSEKQLKSNLREKEILLRELYHRTRNNMEVIASMLQMKADLSQDEELRASFREIVDKIFSMSLVHKKLYEGQNLSQIELKEYIEDFTGHLLDKFGMSNRVSFELSLEEVKVSIDSAIPLGLVIAELITNSFKHAFAKQDFGKICIKLHRDRNRLIVVEYGDNGQGIEPGINLRTLDSMGVNSVFAIVKYQLRGSISYHVSEGLKWNIIFNDDYRETRI
ncbi:MAG: PAS domain S-box protein [Candidatus Cloacimonetes bacterium]|nr:PAS domain S-box protein [Candidatus Cloacimonadota bacterium]